MVIQLLIQPGPSFNRIDGRHTTLQAALYRVRDCKGLENQCLRVVQRLPVMFNDETMTTRVQWFMSPICPTVRRTTHPAHLTPVSAVEMTMNRSGQSTSFSYKHARCCVYTITRVAVAGASNPPPLWMGDQPPDTVKHNSPCLGRTWS